MSATEPLRKKAHIMDTVEEVKVLVPSARVAEFYRWFADWLEQKDSPSIDTDSEANPESPGAPEQQRDQHEAGFDWWNSLTRGERRLFGLWADEAPRPLTANEIVQKLELKGPREIPGIVSWSGRKGDKVGFKIWWNFEYDPVTKEPIYGFFKPIFGQTPTEYAELIRSIRAAAEPELPMA